MKTWILFNEKDELLLAKDAEGYRLPTDEDWKAVKAESHHIVADDWVLRISDKEAPAQMARFTLRQSWRVLSDNEYKRAGKAWEILFWGEEAVYCSKCGNPLRWNTDISRICPQCGREIWPQLNIAIIVLIQKGHEALLVKAKTFRRNFFGLVAGFVETGESLEECVAREVKEETTLEIKNIRYFASQPWPYPLGLMVGFNADYVSGNISFADGELKEASFFRADNLPEIPEGLSMARMLIDDWVAREKQESDESIKA